MEARASDRAASHKTRAALRDARNERAVCAVSTLEMTRLIRSGDMVLRIPLHDWVVTSLADLRAESLPVTDEIAIEAYGLPEPFHRDPADRQIVACARLGGFTLVTADERILGWKHVTTMNARE